ncbi:universal stress protein [Fibrella sp. HMF5335]|uniref:Universal stress protein n=1 Tax=Fibrella rubiginis TaxID=2817060 RepID=A0A939GAG4_9BACT|nr:universal stress protein [Fibrella rubiginis]MBO0935442.1 universal stress protein [Fibrella rubiginis]
MKTIAVATDLTPNANRATHFAMQLAHAQQASLVLINAFHFWPSNPAEIGGDFPLSAKAMYADSQKHLTELARTLQAQFGTDVPIRCITREGYAIPSIRAVAEAEKADLLVMSTVGSAPQSAQLMGSVATEMIAETTVPLLLVPPHAAYGTIGNVVLGIDLNTPPDAITLDSTLHFARLFGCVINVLCVNDKPDDPLIRERAEHIRRLIGSVPHTLTIVTGDEVYDTLLTFAHTNKADLIMMLPQHHNWFWRLFTEGNTERTARLTDIPLLAIV